MQNIHKAYFILSTSWNDENELGMNTDKEVFKCSVSSLEFKGRKAKWLISKYH